MFKTLNSLLEATKVKDKTKADVSDLFRDKTDHLPAASSKNADVKDADKINLGPVASKEKTAKASSKIVLGDKAGEHITNLHKTLGDVPDAIPDQPTTDIVRYDQAKLPKLINRGLRTAGYEFPEWHTVANLPGNMSTGIRKLGKLVFHSYTKTPTEDLIMIGNVGGHGPNTSAEVNAVVKYLKDRGRSLGPGNIDFDKIMPGYEAKVHLYTANHFRFMLVQDDFGQYIYVWPEYDSKI